MKQNDYWESEWSDDSYEDLDALEEDSEQNWALREEEHVVPEEESEDVTVFSEGSDFQNGEYFDFRSTSAYRLYKMEEPPRFESATTNIRRAELCYNCYCRTRFHRYFEGFLHYYEPRLNHVVSRFVQRYSMGGHFEDLKHTAILALLGAAPKFRYKAKTGFQTFIAYFTLTSLHQYTRTMRRGCTVGSDYAYTKLRKVMAVFNNLGGHNDLETLQAVSQETGFDAFEVEDMIQAALQNMQCTNLYRSYSTDDGESDDNREEIAVSHDPGPYEAFLIECQAKALCIAWESLNYREQNMFAAHLAICPECFSVLEKNGFSGKWYDCSLREKKTYHDIAINHSLSSEDTAEHICSLVADKLRKAYLKAYDRLLRLED